MIVLCDKCNGSGEHNHFPEYSKSKCETCAGTGEIVRYYFDVVHWNSSKETNELTVVLNWYKDENKRNVLFATDLPGMVILNHHFTHLMNREQLNDYLIELFDVETMQFDLPEILSIEQVQELYFKNNQNQTTYENRNDNH